MRLDKAEIVETGEYDLEALFVAAGVAAVGAKRVVIDTVEVLFGALSDPSSYVPNCKGCSAGSRSAA